MKTNISQFAAVALLAAVTATSAHAGFVGRTLDATYYYPDLFTPYDALNQAIATPKTFTVGIPVIVETVVAVEGVTFIDVDFTDTTLSFNFTTSLINPTWATTPFNGLVFNRLAGSALSLGSASIDPSSNFAGFGASRVGFTDDQLTINWNGLSYVTGTSLLINFTSAPASVPEPGSLALMGVALGALAYSFRQKRSAKAVFGTPL